MSTDALTIPVPTLSLAGAKLAQGAAERLAVERRLKVSIAVVDCSGNLLVFERLNGACVTSIEAAMRKARTAASLGAPTKVFEDLVQGGMTSLLTFEFICPSQGGIPLALDGAVVGGIGSSGGSGEEDEAVARAGAVALAAAWAKRG